MFLALIKKQIKLLLRSPSEMVTLFVMPIVLICILSFALGSIMEGKPEMTTIELAIIQNEDEKEAFQRFIGELQQNVSLDQQTIENLESSLPVSMLTENLTSDKEVEKLIHVTHLEAEEFSDAKKSGKFDVVLEIPRNFTSDYLNASFFEKEKPAIHVYLNQSEQITSTIVRHILDFYQQQYTLFSVMGQNNLLSEESALPSNEIKSAIRTVDSLEGVSSSVYYTFSMTVMFMLFVASTLASQSYLEKYMHIFDRILLAQIHPSTYLFSIIVSSILFSVLQVMVLFTFSYLIFDISFAHWQLYLLVTMLLALVVGAIAALLSSINYRSNSASASNLFSNVIVAILAFFGGSYFNISSLSPFIAKVGMFTPNGAALDGYLAIAQDGSLIDLLPNITILSSFVVLFMVLALVLFPKRGGIA